ncbi:MAG: hypothetical protein WAM11_06355 [Cyanobium sp.]
MPLTPPRCSGCRNLSGCAASGGVCRVWQVLVHASVASQQHCQHWLARGHG